MDFRNVCRPCDTCREVGHFLLKIGQIHVFRSDNDKSFFLLGDDLKFELPPQVIKIEGRVDSQEQWNSDFYRGKSVTDTRCLLRLPIRRNR